MDPEQCVPSDFCDREDWTVEVVHPRKEDCGWHERSVRHGASFDEDPQVVVLLGLQKLERRAFESSQR
jgi:hypothetical protein